MGAERRIVVLGTRGQLAYALRHPLTRLGEVIAVGRETAPVAVDLEHPEGLVDALVSLHPTVIVNAAAYTAVDAAESEPGTTVSRAVNGVAPGLIAQAARRADALLVHFSTDYVFDGEARRPYQEADATGPLGVYGQTKLMGELAVRASGAAHLILRTSWLYDDRGQNFYRTMRRLARERAVLRVVDDQRGTPTWVGHLARVTTEIVDRLGLDRAHWRARTGTYHLAAGGEATWFEFASAIVEEARRREPVAVERIEAIPTSAYPTPARRPAYSVLDCGAAERTFGLRLPHWREGFDEMLEEAPCPSP